MECESLKFVYQPSKEVDQEFRPLVNSFMEGKEVLFERVESIESLEISAQMSLKEDERPILFLRTKEDYFDIALTANNVLFNGIISDENLIVHLEKESGEEYLLNRIYRVNIEYDESKKSTYANVVHRAIYRLLSTFLGKKLPWGIMTGVRPTKQMLEMNLSGRDNESIKKFYQKEYLCEEKTIDLGIKVIENEKKLLSKIDENNSFSLYVGIPFCPSICAYCSFSSYSIKQYQKYVDAYIKAVVKEIEAAQNIYKDKKLVSVYFGGGTPTSIEASQLDEIIKAVKSNFDFSQVLEFCVEAGRPDSITEEKLEMLIKNKVDRISVNPQSMNQETLDLIGRRHSVEDVFNAFKIARQAGFKNINMDLIIGLYGETPKMLEKTLKAVEELEPESFTMHTLAIKRAARFNTEKESFVGMKAEDVALMERMCLEFAQGHDYKPYYLYRQKNMASGLENIGFAKEGFECLYNVLIMEERHPILALGAGASSKLIFKDENRIERIENVKSVKDYVERIDEMIERKLSVDKWG